VTDGDYLNTDADGDGVTPGEGDCDDTNPGVAAGFYDIPDNYIDEDCTGEDNYDVDRDGHASPASGGDDCNDLLSTVYPGAPENCDDSYDNDCDGVVNEDCAATGDTQDEGCGGCAAGVDSTAFGQANMLAAGAVFLLALGRRRLGEARMAGGNPAPGAAPRP
jgi:hypothetical protein